MSNVVGKVKVLRVLEMMEHDSRACIYGALVSVDTNDIFLNDKFLILDVWRKIISKDNGTQDHDSDSEVDEHVIVVPSFPSNSFVEVDVRDAAASFGYLFSQETAEILSQVEADLKPQVHICWAIPCCKIQSVSAELHS
ncbi:hypothetical protein Tco_0449890 [Tanacetum coccineum]